MLIRVTKRQLLFLYRFQNINLFLYRFQNINVFKLYLHENEALHNPTFYMKMNHFNIAFPIALDK